MGLGRAVVYELRRVAKVGLADDITCSGIVGDRLCIAAYSPRFKAHQVVVVVLYALIVDGIGLGQHIALRVIGIVQTYNARGYNRGYPATVVVSVSSDYTTFTLTHYLATGILFQE